MSLLLGKCVASAKRNVVRSFIPQMKLDTFLNKYFRENDSILAYDAKNSCKVGDWVLLKKLDTKYGIEVDYAVEKIVYEAGNIIDPLTGKRSMGYENIDDLQRLSTLFKQAKQPK